MFGFRRGDMPEPPPEGWDRLGLHPGYTVKRMPTLAEVDRYCRANHVSANDAYIQHDIEACVIPKLREVVLPASGVFKDPAKEKAVETHEYLHTWDAKHHDGKGWFGPDDKPLPPLSASLASMMRSMAESQIRLAQQQSKVPMKGGG